MLRLKPKPDEMTDEEKAWIECEKIVNKLKKAVSEIFTFNQSETGCQSLRFANDYAFDDYKPYFDLTYPCKFGKFTYKNQLYRIMITVLTYRMPNTKRVYEPTLFIRSSKTDHFYRFVADADHFAEKFYDEFKNLDNFLDVVEFRKVYDKERQQFIEIDRKTIEN